MDSFTPRVFICFRLLFYVDIVEIAMCFILSSPVGVACVVGSDDKVSSVCSRSKIICIISIFMITKFVGHESF